MTYFITAIGIIYVIFGVVYFIRPDYARAVIDFFKAGKRIYIGGIIRLVLGALLIYAAQNALVPWVPRAIGILAVAGGITIYALGIGRVHAMMDWWKGLSDNRLRIIAVVAELVGILLIYSA